MRFLHCKRGTAAVEAAIFLPIFVVLTLGIADLGAGMFVRTQVNGTAQSGVMFGFNDPACAAARTAKVMDATCLNAIRAVMNDAVGRNDPLAPFCGVTQPSPPAIPPCSAEIITSADPRNICNSPLVSMPRSAPLAGDTPPLCCPPSPVTGADPTTCLIVSVISPYMPLLRTTKWTQATIIPSIATIRYQ